MRNYIQSLTRRSTRISLCLALAASLVWLGVIWQRRERYSLYRDVRDGQRYINLIANAERTCYGRLGRYISPADLEGVSCDNLRQATSETQKAGFSSEIHAEGPHFTVRLIPSSKTRLISLYSDETGNIRFGTRDALATSASPLLH